MKKRILSSLLIGCLCGSLMCGCTEPEKRVREAEDIDIKESEVAPNVSFQDCPDNTAQCVSDFGLTILKEAYSANDCRSTMISPVSVMIALGMAANGADGATLEQMQECMGMTTDGINQVATAFGQNSDDNILTCVNGIWVNDSRGVNLFEEYRRTVEGRYGAQVEQTVFGPQTAEEINGFVSDATNGQIPGILNEVTEDMEVILVNALSFDAQWEVPFMSQNSFDDDFVNVRGENITVTMMHNSEFSYICGDNETGFIKHYDDRSYSFVALLPEENEDIYSYLDTLDGTELQELIENVRFTEVHIGLPIFETDYMDSMKDILADMGIREAFTAGADFSRMADENSSFYISDVIHASHIRVDEAGTQAAASTAIAMNGTAAEPEPIPEVILNRPFVYFIIDNAGGIPVFMGVYSGC